MKMEVQYLGHQGSTDIPWLHFSVHSGESPVLALHFGISPAVPPPLYTPSSQDTPSHPALPPVRGKGQEVFFHSEGCSKATTVQHARNVWQRVKSTPVQVTVVGIIWDVQWVRVWRYQDALCGHGGERWPSQLVESMGQEGMMHFY